MAGKAPESAELKATTKAYDKLSESDQLAFRGKIFAKMVNGLTKEQRKTLKKERNEFLNHIAEEKKKVAQAELIEAMTIEQLESILNTKKNAKKTEKKPEEKKAKK